MKASNEIHELATKTGLRFDLESAFNAGKSNGMVLTGTWLGMLDSESYSTLRSISKITDGSYSLNSLGEAIIKNKKIRLNETL
jgi:hypothetical protein